MTEAMVDFVPPCTWCDQPAITKTEDGMRACWHHAALDGVRSQRLADSKVRMDAVEADIARRRAASGAIRVSSMHAESCLLE